MEYPVVGECNTGFEMRDLFVTHDWRDNDERDRALALIDAELGLNWRNYGNTWYDPAVQFSSPEGIVYLKDRLETQLLPAKAVILVPSIYSKSQRGKTWVGLSITRARELKLPILGLSDSGENPSDAAVASLADRWVAWNGKQILQAVDELMAKS